MQWFKRVLVFIVQAMLVLLPVSCKKETHEEDVTSGNKQEGGGLPRLCSVYFRIQSGYDTDTRASGDYADAEPDEYVISNQEGANIAILFKESDGKFYGVYPLSLAVENDDIHEDEHEKDIIYKTTYELEAETIPSFQCLVVLNAPWVYERLSGNAEDWKDKKKADVMDLVWDKEVSGDDDPRKIGRFVGSDGKTYHTMSSSVYFNGNKPEDTVGISSANIITDKDSDEQKKEKIVVIHVERMLSKFSFSIAPNADMTTSGEYNEIFHLSNTPDIVWFNNFDGNGAPDYFAHSWRIEITGWGLNALENSSYLFKKVNNDGRYDDGKEWTNWNAAAEYRSDWAEDPTYDKEKYPWQYRSGGYEPVDKVPYYSYADPNGVGMTLLKNYSFDELQLEKKNETDKDVHFSQIIYTPESTFDAAKVRGTHDDRDELLAATHLLVGAELQIDLGDNGTYVAKDVFRDRNGFFYGNERECFAVMVHAFNLLLESQLSMDYTYYKWNTIAADKYFDFVEFEKIGDYYKPNWSKERDIRNRDMLAAKPASVLVYYDDDDRNPYNDNPFGAHTDPYKGDYDFSLYWVNEKGEYRKLTSNGLMAISDAEFFETYGGLALGTIPKGDGQRLPWPAKGKLVVCNSSLTPIYIYTSDVNEELMPTVRKELRFASDNDVKSLLYEWVGPIDHFCEGKMYYSHGIEQYPSRYTEDESGQPIVDAEGNKTSLTGRYGAVRNNWYQFRVTKIMGLGVPVDDVTQKIVPDRATPHDQINVSVDIIDWHEEVTNTPDLT